MAQTIAFWTAIIILVFGPWTNGCMIKPVDKKKNFWDMVEKYERPVHSSDCVCGVAQEENKHPWNVFVHTTLLNNEVKTCTGTIVNSNTIVTSHQCLKLNPESRIRLVDFLKYPHGSLSIARPAHVQVTNTLKMTASNAVKFTVVDIWYNPRYMISSELDKFPENDMALLKVSEDIFSKPGFIPICVPAYDEKMEDDKLQFRESGYFYFEKEGTTSSKNGDIFSISGKIMRKSDPSCGKATNEKEIDSHVVPKTLCMPFKANAENENVGGPVVFSSASHDFLLGLTVGFSDPARQTGRDASVGNRYAYFSWIHPMIKFLEHFSQQKGQESKWCIAPKVNFKARATIQHPDDDEDWPWEMLDASIIRDESLDCVCGVANTMIGGRIAGGVEATPREFGWMTLLNFYSYGRGGSVGFCGGAIITDRLVATAAHCVVIESKLNAGKDESDLIVAPENVDVFLNAHLRRNDPDAIKKEVSAVLYHPQYVKGRRKGYYDTDIALLVLKEPLDFASTGRGLRPICLPKLGDYMEVLERNALVVGWGLTDPNDRNSAADKLQKVEVPIQKLTMCSTVALRVTDNFLCAGTLNEYKDAARGDSGGPMQMEDRDESQWYEVGLVSYGEPQYRNGKKLVAALYTDVQKMLPFIEYHANRVGAKWCNSTKPED